MQLGNRPTYGQIGTSLRFAFETIDVPGATLTSADGNSTHAISGEFDDAAGKHGFVLSGGAFTPFDFPGTSFTQITGINANGELSGNYFDPRDSSPTHFHGFFRSQDGHVTPLDPPGSIRSQAGSLNAQGQVVGVYRDIASVRHGFVWQAGVFTTFSDPDATQVAPGGTVPFGINDRGQIVGNYVNRNDHLRHGFLLSGGAYTTIDAPGSSFTVAEGINNPGVIAGYFVDGVGIPGGGLPDGTHHGFVLSAGVYTTVDVPGALSTEIYSINAIGEIVGQYVDAGEGAHGFVGRPVR